MILVTHKQLIHNYKKHNTLFLDFIITFNFLVGDNRKNILIKSH